MGYTHLPGPIPPSNPAAQRAFLLPEEPVEARSSGVGSRAHLCPPSMKVNENWGMEEDRDRHLQRDGDSRKVKRHGERRKGENLWEKVGKQDKETNPQKGR